MGNRKIVVTFAPVHRYCCVVFAIFLMLAAALPVQAADEAEATIFGQHVTKKLAVAPEFITKIWEHQKKLCEPLGKKIPPIPDGDLISETIEDTYLVAGAEVIREVTATYMIDADCKVIRQKTAKTDIFTAQGYCLVKTDLKQAVGHCRIPITQLTQQWKRPKRQQVGQYTNEILTIAGRKCAVIFQQSNQFKSRLCVLQTDQFAKISEHRNWFPGMVLKRDNWFDGKNKQTIAKGEATNVEADVSIPVTTLLPHLFGNYKIIP
jgi:hypothetical protein